MKGLQSGTIAPTRVQRITVLVQGSILVEGPPEGIATDPEVRRVYLGEREPT